MENSTLVVWDTTGCVTAPSWLSSCMRACAVKRSKTASLVLSAMQGRPSLSYSRKWQPAPSRDKLKVTVT